MTIQQTTKFKILSNNGHGKRLGEGRLRLVGKMATCSIGSNHTYLSLLQRKVLLSYFVSDIMFTCRTISWKKSPIDI